MPWPSLDSLIAPFASAANYLPSLPLVPIPAKLQQRLVTFLLRRAIGGFVKGGGHSLGDEGRIEADVRKGRLVVRDVEIDEAAINSLLSPTSSTDPSQSSAASLLRFERGSVKSITTLIAWPLSRLDIVADEIELVFRIATPPATSPAASPADRTTPERAAEARSRQDEDIPEPDLLAESHVSLAIAHQFVSHELLPSEDAELRASLHLSPSQSIDLPGAFGGTPRSDHSPAAGLDDTHAEEVEATMLAGVIEKLLARLGVTVQNVRIRLVWTSGVDAGGLGGATTEHELELRVDRIDFRGGAADEAEPGGDPQRRPTKKVTIAPARLYLHSRASQQPAPPLFTAQPPYRRRTSATSAYSSSTSSASSSEDEHDMLAMSQSVADLRTSMHASSTASRSDLFASAKSRIFDSVAEEPESEEDVQRADPFVNPDASSQPTSSPTLSPDAEDEGELLACFGVTEPIVFKLSSAAGGSTDQQGVELRGRLGDLVSVGIRPEQLRLFSDLAAQMMASSASSTQASPPTPSPAPSRRSRAGATLSILLPSLRLAIATQYETPYPESFWTRPSLPLAIPHLRLSLEEIKIAGQTSSSRGFEASVKAVTVVEAAVAEDGSLRVLPILVSDSNLSAPSSRPWPDLDVLAHDWVVNPTQQYGKDWRLLPRVVAEEKRTNKFRSSLGNNDGTTRLESPSAIRVSRAVDGGSKLELQPLHVFLDAALLTRLDDLFDAVVDRKQHLSSTTAKSRPPAQQPSSPPKLAGAPPTGGFVTTITCPLVRFELRCPAPLSLRDTAQNEDLLRGGRLILDVCAPEVGLTREQQTLRAEEIRAYLVPAHASRGRAFFALSALQDDEGDHGAYQPSLTVSSAATDGSRPSRLDVDIPLVRVSLDKGLFDSFQLLADDLSRFLAKEVSLGASDPDAQWSRSDKMIGSRFFGTKSYMHPKRRRRAGGLHERETETDSAASTATLTAEDTRSGTQSRDEGAGARSKARTTFVCRLNVTDLLLDIALGEADARATDRQLLRVKADDLSLDAETLVDGDDNLRVKLAVTDCDVKYGCFLAGDGVKAPSKLLHRTLARSPTERPVPLLKLDFASATERETNLKESKVQLALANLTVNAGPDISWVDELLAFVRVPEGAFEEVVPNELLRLRIRLSETSLRLSAPTSSSAVTLVVGDARIRSDLMPDLPRTAFQVDLDRTRLLAVASSDDLASVSEPRSAPGETGASWRYWRDLGFVPIADLATLTAHIRVGNGLVLPDLDVSLDRLDAVLTICADTLPALAAFASDVQRWVPIKTECVTVGRVATALILTSEICRKPSPLGQQRASSEEASRNLLASVVDAAFERAPTVDDSPIQLNDDVPVNEDYLADALRSTKGPRSGTTPKRLLRPSHDSVGIISNIDGETIKVFTPEGLHIVDGWLDDPRVEEAAHSAYGARLRVRVDAANLSIRLYEGFDWEDTRKAIQERARVVRRRLQKIRQLLASGQTADASAEDASVVMFGSVQLGLPAGASELPPKDLLAAIDHELEDSPDADAQSTIAASRRAASEDATVREKRPAASTKAAGMRRRRLTRPAFCAVEISLRGINALFEAFDPDSRTSSRVSRAHEELPPLLSRLELDVAHLDILDNVQTSTWHKFLTELRPNDGGVVRPTDTPMARVEISTVRGETEASAAQGEILLKAKVAPLRLYIDQDALDFLKAFGAFQAPQPAASLSERTTPNAETFYQRVEIMSVKLKLDYKPKRVDFNALRSGKTAELMNFFHFEGSEMTLRHLVVTGVSGTSTLSSLVQDIWTPDVKANQLADVVSGIAPLRSVVNVGSGVANLVLLPIEQYRKNGRLVRGLQKGAQAFAKQTTLEAIHTGAKLATGTQVILEQAEHVLGGSFARPISAETIAPAFAHNADTLDSSDDAVDDGDRSDARSRYANQPANLRQGVEGAYKSFGDNLKDAAQTILAVPMEVYERSSDEGAMRAVVRAVPLAVLKPMIGASGAVSKALLGLRNTLDPHAQEGELEDKYKATAPSRSR